MLGIFCGSIKIVLCFLVRRRKYNRRQSGVKCQMFFYYSRQPIVISIRIIGSRSPTRRSSRCRMLARWHYFLICGAFGALSLAQPDSSISVGIDGWQRDFQCRCLVFRYSNVLKMFSAFRRSEKVQVLQNGLGVQTFRKRLIRRSGMVRTTRAAVTT